MPLLDVDNLETNFYTEEGVVNAVDGVSFSLETGNAVGIVGESGAGKTVTALSIMGLIDENVGRIESGSIWFDGQDLATLSNRELREVRGDRIAMVFQDPMTALDPVYTVGEQIADVVEHHRDASREAAWERAVEMLDQVGIPDPAERANSYPHELSGGMQQRALIGMALSCNPDLLIADEPTTSLDVTTEAKILTLLEDLRAEFDMSLIYISHDLGVISEVCDEVLVMYAGEIVEKGTVGQIFENPRHPYTVGLLKSIPRLGQQRERLDPIEGTMPDLIDLPTGCSYRTRCPHARDDCAAIEPDLYDIEPGHAAACLMNRGVDVEDTADNEERTGGK